MVYKHLYSYVEWHSISFMYTILYHSMYFVCASMKLYIDFLNWKVVYSFCMTKYRGGMKRIYFYKKKLILM